LNKPSSIWNAYGSKWKTLSVMWNAIYSTWKTFLTPPSSGNPQRASGLKPWLNPWKPLRGCAVPVVGARETSPQGLRALRQDFSPPPNPAKVSVYVRQADGNKKTSAVLMVAEVSLFAHHAYRTTH
jgi:hypothetical protein